MKYENYELDFAAAEASGWMPNCLQLEQDWVFSFPEGYLKQSVILNLCVKALPFAKFLALFQAWSHLAEVVFDVFSGSLFSESASECVSVFSNREEHIYYSHISRWFPYHIWKQKRYMWQDPVSMKWAFPLQRKRCSFSAIRCVWDRYIKGTKFFMENSVVNIWWVILFFFLRDNVSSACCVFLSLDAELWECVKGTYLTVT